MLGNDSGSNEKNEAVIALNTESTDQYHSQFMKQLRQRVAWMIPTSSTGQ
jgi:hypothetical protein